MWATFQKEEQSLLKPKAFNEFYGTGVEFSKILGVETKIFGVQRVEITDEITGVSQFFGVSSWTAPDLIQTFN